MLGRPLINSPETLTLQVDAYVPIAGRQDDPPSCSDHRSILLNQRIQTSAGDMRDQYMANSGGDQQFHNMVLNGGSNISTRRHPTSDETTSCEGRLSCHLLLKRSLVNSKVLTLSAG